MGALLKRGGKEKDKWQERECVLPFSIPFTSVLNALLQNAICFRSAGYFAMLPADGLLWTVRGQTKKISVDDMLEVRPYADETVREHSF